MLLLALTGTRLLTVPGDFQQPDIFVWDITTLDEGVIAESLEIWPNVHDSLFLHLALSPDGNYFATTSLDATAKLWDANTGDLVLTLLGHAANVGDMAFSPDSAHMATISVGEVRIWDISEAGQGEILNIADDGYYPVYFLKDTNALITSNDNGMVKVWDITTGALLRSFGTQLPNRRVSSFDVSSDERYIARSSEENVFGIWDLETGAEIFTRTAHGPGIQGDIFTGILAVSFSPDGQLLATGGADGYVKLWDVASGEELSEWRADPRNSVFWGGEGVVANAVTNVEFSSSGRWLAATTDEADGTGGIIKIWDVESGEEIQVIEDSPRRLYGIDFTQDDTLIASSGSGGVMRVWEVASGKRVADLGGATVTVSIIMFSEDDQQLFTGVNPLGVYDFASQELRYQFRESINYPVLSEDGRYFATTGINGIHIYTLDFEELVTIAQSRVTRGLTDAECKEYLHVDVCPSE